jgi:hypothetical protein
MQARKSHTHTATHARDRTRCAIAWLISFTAGKKRRLTFFECPNDMNAMLDIAKVADLVLLVVDAHFGFEMVLLSLPSSPPPSPDGALGFAWHRD